MFSFSDFPAGVSCTRIKIQNVIGLGNTLQSYCCYIVTSYTQQQLNYKRVEIPLGHVCSNE